MKVLRRTKLFIFIISVMAMSSLQAMNQTFIQVTNHGHGNTTTIIVNNSHPNFYDDYMDIVTSDSDDEMDIEIVQQNGLVPVVHEHASHQDVSSSSRINGPNNNCVDLSGIEDNSSNDEGIVDARTVEPLKCSMCQTEYDEQSVHEDISCCAAYHLFCTTCITDWKRTKNSCPTPGCVKTLDQLISNNHTQSYLKRLQESLAEHDVRKINVLTFFLKKKQNQQNTSLPRVVINLDEQNQINSLRTPRTTQHSLTNNQPIRVVNNGQASNPIVVESNAPRPNRFFRLNRVARDVQEIIIIEDDVVSTENSSKNSSNSDKSNSVADVSQNANVSEKENPVVPQEGLKQNEPADNSLLSSVKSTVQSYCVIS